VLLVLMFRPYVALALVPAVMAGIAFATLGRRGEQRIAKIAILVLGLLLTPTAIRIGTQNSRWRAEEARSYVAAVGALRESAGTSGSGLSGYKTTREFILTLPSAAATILFRPFVWEAHNTTSLIAALDTILILLLVMSLVWTITTHPGTARRARRQPGFGFLLLLFCGLMLELSNLTGNLGTMVRARIQFMPALLLLAAVVAARADSPPEREPDIE